MAFIGRLHPLLIHFPIALGIAALVAEAVENGALELEPLDVGEIELMQVGQSQRKRMILARTAAMAVTLRPRPRMKGLLIREAARRARISEAARNFLGTIRRIVIRKR